MTPQRRNPDLACLRGAKTFTAASLGGLSGLFNASLCRLSRAGGATSYPHLGLVAGAGHPALQEAEGPADFVLLRLGLGRDYVLVPLLVLDPVSAPTTTKSALLPLFWAGGKLSHSSPTCF